MSELESLKEKYKIAILHISSQNIQYSFIGATDLIEGIIEEAYHARDEEIEQLKKENEKLKQQNESLTKMGLKLEKERQILKQQATLEPLDEEMLGDFLGEITEYECMCYDDGSLTHVTCEHCRELGEKAKKICQKFGTPRHDDLVERIEKIIKTEQKYSTNVKIFTGMEHAVPESKRIAQAIAKEIANEL